MLQPYQRREILLPVMADRKRSNLRPDPLTDFALLAPFNAPGFLSLVVGAPLTAGLWWGQY